MGGRERERDSTLTTACEPHSQSRSFYHTVTNSHHFGAVDYVQAEAVLVLKDLLRKYPHRRGRGPLLLVLAMS